MVQIVSTTIEKASEGGLVKYSDESVLSLAPNPDRVHVGFMGEWVWSFFLYQDVPRGENEIGIIVRDSNGEIAWDQKMNVIGAQAYITGMNVVFNAWLDKHEDHLWG